jgi:MFS transporter, ACS family, tartrate transporter
MDNSQDSAIARAALSKASWRILPLLGLGYLIAYMDRANVSFASLQMNLDLGFSATVYGLGAGMFFLSYSIFEIPSNLLLVRFGARRWIARIMITWGILAAAMMFVATPMQFYAMRFLIGMAEAGFFPGVIYYLTHWFPGAQRGRAISVFYLFNPLATVVMGVLSVWLLSLDGLGDLRGWQWLFLVQGLPAVLIGLAILVWLPDAPAKAKWLSDAERSWLTGALARDQAQHGAPEHGSLLASLRNPLVLWLAMMYMLSIASWQTLSLSGPAVLKAATGLETATVGYVVSLGGIMGVLAMLTAGWFCDRRGRRFAPLLFGLCAEVAALLVIALAPSVPLVVLGYLTLAGATGAVAVSQTTIWTDVFPVRVLGINAAAINTFLQMGTFVGPIAFGMARDGTGSYTAGLLGLPVALTLSLLFSVLFMRKLNKR